MRPSMPVARTLMEMLQQLPVGRKLIDRILLPVPLQMPTLLEEQAWTIAQTQTDQMHFHRSSLSNSIQRLKNRMPSS